MKKIYVNRIILSLILLLIVAALILISYGKEKVNSLSDNSNEVAQLDVAPPNGGVITYEAPLKSRVNEGQTVLKLDPSQYTAQADADKAKLYNDEQILSRDIELSKESGNGVISKEELLTAMFNVKEDKAALRVDESYVKQCTVKSPFTGTVTKIVNYQGSGVGSGNEIMDITAAG